MKTRKILAITAIMLAIGVILTMIARAELSPAVKEAYYTPDADDLRKVPAEIVIVRPTHFEKEAGKVRHVHDGDSLARTVGRNVSLRDMMAEAYDCSPGRVVLPADATKQHFDFLVTVPQTRKHLREAIQKSAGYTGRHETRDTGMMVLTVANPTLPGLTVSGADEDADASYTNGRLYFKHQPLNVVLKGLEDGLMVPIEDQTALTNYYDFSVVWNKEIQAHMQAGTFDVEGVKKVLAGWGLRLDSGTTNMDMVIVQNGRH